MKARFLVALFAVALALPASAQGVSKVKAERPAMVMAMRSGAYTSSLQVGGLPALEMPLRLTKLAAVVGVISGGGAGNTVLTVSDGTNTCTFTLACATSGTIGVYNVAAVNGAGTGCSYATGATLTATVTTAGCTTTQPSMQGAGMFGFWR